MFVSLQNKFLFYIGSFTVVFLSLFVLLGNASAAKASVFQFTEDDPNYLLALSVAAAQEAQNEVDVAEKINLDEDFTPEDFKLSGGGVGFLPTSPLYIFKSIRRGITAGFTFDDIEKAKLRLQFAAEKILEAKELATRDRSDDIIVNALQNYEEELARIQRGIADLTAAGDERSLELARALMDTLTKSQKMLGAFERDLSPEVFGRVQEIKTATAQTFTGVFNIVPPEIVSEELVKILDEQKGSEFKHFKNIEVLKELADHAQTVGRGALTLAEADALSKLQASLETGDATHKALFGEFIQGAGGNETRHIEIVSELEARPLSEEARSVITAAKEEVFLKTEQKLEALSPEQKEQYLSHLAKGDLADIRIVKELENNITGDARADIEKIKTQATEELKKKIETAAENDEQKQEFLTSVERFHDARSVAVLNEIEALIPQDKKEFFTTLKQKAVSEIANDINRARDGAQREQIYKALAGDHPEDVAAIQKLQTDRTVVSSSARGILEALRKTQYEQVQNKALAIEDEDRLAKFEEDYQKFVSYFTDTGTPLKLEAVIEQKKTVFADPSKAEQRLASARGSLSTLRALIDALPFDLGYQAGTFDPVIQQIERTYALAEKKISVAETSLEYGDAGRAYGEATAAGEIADNGIKTAKEYKAGRRQEQKVPDFLPKDFFKEKTTEEIQKGTIYKIDIYNDYEFNQFCAFTKGFIKGKFVCQLSDGRILDISNERLPFRVPQEFVPQKVTVEDKTVECAPIYVPAVVDYCKGGKIVYDKDARGCPLSPRCEYPGDTEKDTEKEKICQAYFEGYVYKTDSRGVGSCIKESASGCTDPFVYKTKEQCEKGQQTIVASQCSDGRDNDFDGFIDYPADTGCYGPADPDEAYGGEAKSCLSQATESSCKSTGCTWYPKETHADGPHCDDAAHGKAGQICPAMPTVTSCPAGQKMVISYESPECGTYYACVSDTTATTTSAAWIQHTWRFTDGDTSSMILSRTDAEYLNFIKDIENQCLKISKSKFAWRPGAGNDSIDNWQNFGIPDCSGTAVNYVCGNNSCDIGETTASCPADCGGTTGGTPQCSDGIDNDGDGAVDYPSDTGCSGPYDGTESYEGTGGSGCGSYLSSSACTGVSGCKWTASSSSTYGGYCEPTGSIGGGSGIPSPTNLTASLTSDSKSVVLAWGNSATNITEFKIYRKSGSVSSWAYLTSVVKTGTQTVPPFTYTDSNPPSGSLEYQVQACTSISTCSYDSNRAYITIGGTGGTGTLGTQQTPTGLTAALLSSGTDVELKWTDNATTENEFKIWRNVGGSWSFLISVPTVTSVQQMNYIDRNVPFGTLMYHVQACNTSGCTPDSNQASVSRGGSTTGCGSLGTGWTQYQDYCFNSSYTQYVSASSPSLANVQSCTGNSAPVYGCVAPNSGTGTCSTAANCTTLENCTASHFYWYNSICNNSPQGSSGGSGCTSAVSCTDSTSCGSAGFYWYNNVCNTSPQGGTTTSGPASYTSQSSCTGAGYYWCSTYSQCYLSSSGCTTTGSSCSTPSTCFDSAVCTSSGWYWYNSGCWSSPQTTSSTGGSSGTCSTPGNCTDQATCQASYFFWYDGACHSTAQSYPSTTDPSHYTSQSSCNSAGYTWCPSLSACTVPGSSCPSSGAAVYGLQKLFPRFFSR